MSNERKFAPLQNLHMAIKLHERIERHMKSGNLTYPLFTPVITTLFDEAERQSDRTNTLMAAVISFFNHSVPAHVDFDPENPTEHMQPIADELTVNIKALVNKLASDKEFARLLCHEYHEHYQSQGEEDNEAEEDTPVKAV